MSKSIVLSPFYPVSDKLDVSHRAGWARYWAAELTRTGQTTDLLTTRTMAALDETKKGDLVYLYHGMEWSGAMNLQSGLTDEIVARADRLIGAVKRGAKVLSLDVPMPQYGQLLEKRGFNRSEDLTKALARKGFLPTPNERTKHVIMGDSHALSQYVPGAVIYRTDGQTLHGALQQGLAKRLGEWGFMTGVDLYRLPKLTVYFGNIDIRHHLLREGASSYRDMLKEYMKQLDEVVKLYKIKELEVVAPLPIENECRILPQTGWYKGTPFFGTWKERTELRKLIVTGLKRETTKHGFTLIDHPKHFTNKQGELTFDVMEQPRSVHIRPAEYRLVQESGRW